VTGIEPVTPCLQSLGNFNLSRRFGCAYLLRAYLDCSNVAPNHNKQFTEASPRSLLLFRFK
jgi:hypothetical protein